MSGATSSSEWTHPFQGEQYIAVTLTSKSYHDEFIPLESDDWVQGGMPADSCVIPWGIESPDHDDLVEDLYQGYLREDVVNTVAQNVTNYLGLDIDYRDYRRNS